MGPTCREEKKKQDSFQPIKQALCLLKEKYIWKLKTFIAWL
jgi:hypothetical protein